MDVEELVVLFVFGFLAAIAFVIAWVTVPDRWHGALFGKRALLVWLLCAIAAPFIHAWMWRNVWDTRARRQLVAHEIREIADAAIADPANEKHIRELLSIAKGSYSFAAAYATATLGTVGPAATPVIREIAALMKSDDPFVRREAALSLGELGPLSAPAIDILERQVMHGWPTDETTCFAAESIGCIGPAARDSLPLLRSQLGRSQSLDRSLNRAIEMLESTDEAAPENVSLDCVQHHFTTSI